MNIEKIINTFIEHEDLDLSFRDNLIGLCESQENKKILEHWYDGFRSPCDGKCPCSIDRAESMDKANRAIRFKLGIK